MTFYGYSTTGKMDVDGDVVMGNDEIRTQDHVHVMDIAGDSEEVREGPEYGNMVNDNWDYHGPRPGPSQLIASHSRHATSRESRDVKSYYSRSIPSSLSQSVVSDPHPSTSATRLAVPTVSGSPSPSLASRPSSVNRDDWYPIHPSPNRIFQIMYIPDPSRQASRSEADGDLGWADRHISATQYDAIKHLKGFVYKVSNGKNSVKVKVCEWVSKLSLL